MIYFDNSATTAVCPEAGEMLISACQNFCANPSSLYTKGLESEQIIAQTAQTAANILSCRDDEIYFTSGATESNNLAILGAFEAKRRQGNKILCSSVEHPSVIKTVLHLQKQQSAQVKWIYPNDFRLTPEQFADAADGQTVLVCCMSVNNENGAVFPVDEICRAVKRKFPNIHFHTDITQSFCKLPLNLSAANIDTAAFSGHKIYASKGVGGLYVNKKSRVLPLMFGGEQQKSLRPGTQAVELIAALDAAIAFAHKQHAADKNLAAYLRKQLGDCVTYNSPLNGASHILNFSADGIGAEILLHALEAQDIFVSSGSACAKGKKSEVLKGFGLSDKRISSALRVSFGWNSTTDEIDIFVRHFKSALERFAPKPRKR